MFQHWLNDYPQRKQEPPDGFWDKDDGTISVQALAESGVYHPIWDDLPALYDPAGNLLNASALATRAQNRADAYYATIQGSGGNRRQQIYSGLVNIAPGATLSGVAWRQDLASLADPSGDGGGLATEIVTMPAMQLRVSDNGQFEEALQDSSALRPPDLRVKEPVWPDLLQVVNTSGTTPLVQLDNSDMGKWENSTQCSVIAAMENWPG